MKGKKIVITGGAGGLGSILAKNLSQLGAEPIIVDRSAESQFASVHIQGDLSSLEGVEKIANELKKYQVDVLINLAGIQYFGLFEDQKAENVALTYFVNLVAPVLLTQAVLPQMKKRGDGQIVNIGSIFASINFAHFVTYSSSKAGVKAFSEALRRELKGSGVHVSYVAPRSIKTPLNSAKVLQMAKATKMNMDSPEFVANHIIEAIKHKKKDVYIGFPESLFVRINGLLPRMVDSALAKNDAIARTIINN